MGTILGQPTGFSINRAKRTLSHIIVALGIDWSRRMCDINLNGIFLDYFELWKCKVK